MKKRNFLIVLTNIFLLAILIAGCKKNDSTDTVATAPAHVVGEAYQGGIIAYILQSGDVGYDSSTQHGIIVAPIDQNDGEVVAWGSTGPVGGTSTAIGLGQANTNKIVAYYARVYAAHICNNLVLGGYDDWYLPSKEELLKVYQVKASINISGDRYWSSTETNSAVAVTIRFMDGVSIDQTKTITNKVRAVRSF